MSFTALLTYGRNILAHIPWEHWTVMGVLAVMTFLWARKKCPVYGAVSLGFAVFVGLLLLDTAVGIRYWGLYDHGSGIVFKFDLDRLFRGTGQSRVELFSNVAVFIPFGFFLSEYLASAGRLQHFRRVGFATLVAFGLSLCMECLQLVFHVGFFEWVDMMMNTIGAFVGALCSFLLQRAGRSDI